MTGEGDKNKFPNHREWRYIMKKFKGIRMNLQTFAGEESFEDDDTILPDDFEEQFGDGTPTDDDTNLESEELPEGDEQPAAEGEQNPEGLTQEQQEQLFKLKYNSEELELPESEVIKFAQMGMNYEKVQGRLQALENDPRLQFVNELAEENQYDDPMEFLEMFKAQREQERIDELVQNNIPEEYAREMVESRKHREEQQKMQEKQQQEQQEQREYIDFFEQFRRATGKDFNPDNDKIPQEVLDIRAQEGVPLKFAYMQFHNQQLQQQISVFKQNESNQKKAPLKGGVTNHGSGDAPLDDFLLGFESYD